MSSPERDDRRNKFLCLILIPQVAWHNFHSLKLVIKLIKICNKCERWSKDCLSFCLFNQSENWNHNIQAEWQLPDSTLRACWNITRDHRARLVWSNRDFFRILQIYLQYLLSYILKFLICIHAGNPRVPARVLASGPKPCGGNNTGQKDKAFFTKKKTLLFSYPFGNLKNHRLTIKTQIWYFS